VSWSPEFEILQILRGLQLPLDLVVVDDDQVLMIGGQVPRVKHEKLDEQFSIGMGVGV